MLVRHLVQPLIQAGLLWLLLAGILRLDFSRSVTAYPPFLLAGLLAWSFASTVVGGAALCLSNNASLVRRVAFPREALVYSVAVQGFVQLGVTTIALAGVVVAVPGSSPLGGVVLLWLIPVFAVLGLLSIGLGLIVAVLSALLPDTALAMPLVLQAWFYATPIVYPAATAPPWLAASFRWNPLAVIVDAVRRVVLDGSAPDGGSLLYVAVLAVAVFGIGRGLFRRCDRLLPDLL